MGPMPVLTAFLNLQTGAEEANEWILALIKALQGKSANWTLTIGSRDDQDFAFEVSPPLTSEEISDLAQAALSAKGRSSEEGDDGK